MRWTAPSGSGRIATLLKTEHRALLGGASCIAIAVGVTGERRKGLAS